MLTFFTILTAFVTTNAKQRFRSHDERDGDNTLWTQQDRFWTTKQHQTSWVVSKGKNGSNPKAKHRLQKPKARVCQGVIWNRRCPLTPHVKKLITLQTYLTAAVAYKLFRCWYNAKLQLWLFSRASLQSLFVLFSLLQSLRTVAHRAVDGLRFDYPKRDCQQSMHSSIERAWSGARRSTGENVLKWRLHKEGLGSTPSPLSL